MNNNCSLRYKGCFLQTVAPVLIGSSSLILKRIALDDETVNCCRSEDPTQSHHRYDSCDVGRFLHGGVALLLWNTTNMINNNVKSMDSV